MDLIGEIVERETGAPQAPVAAEATGFPSTKKYEARKSRFKANVGGRKPVKFESKKTSRHHESEAEKIHRENLQKLASMSPEEIVSERAELLSGLDPKLVQSLVKRAEKREHNHNHNHAEGYNGWIGGMRTASGLQELSQLDSEDIDKALGVQQLSLDEDEDTKTPSAHGNGERAQEGEHQHGKEGEKAVRFDDVTTVKYDGGEDAGWEDVEDLNDLIPGNEQIAPKDYQLVNEDENHEEVHFPKPATQAIEYGHDLDLDDPEFYEKLHEKYYPDLPRETSKLAWMTDPMPVQRSTTYESISDMRFDFQGNLIALEATKDTAKDIPTYLGLHHHADSPHLPGYTLAELAHLSRSVVPGQRCLSIQMLGRILFKLGKHKYNIMPMSAQEEDEAFNASVKEISADFETMMWELVSQARIIESLTEAADEAKTRNVSVRAYAIEALWLWRQGGGKPATSESDELAKFV